MLLLDYARNTLGLSVRGIHNGQHVCYTTDAAKAGAMREAGARVTRCAGSTETDAHLVPAATFAAWEVSFGIGAEVRAAA